MATLFRKGYDFEISQKVTSKGLEYVIFNKKDQTENLSFPIQYSKYISLKDLVKKAYFIKLQALEELWLSNQLIECEKGKYLLPKDVLYELDGDLLEILGFKDDEGLEISIYPFMMVGSKDFKIKYEVYHPGLGYISNYAQISSPLICIEEDHLILLNKNLAELITTIESAPSYGKEQIPYVANVQELARKSGAKLDTYLENENYYFPQNIDIEIVNDSPDSLTIKPTLLDFPKNLVRDEDDVVEKGYWSVSTLKGKRHRVIIDEAIKEKYKQINEQGKLEGQEVPRFIENPFNFEVLLPEGFDIDKFSERVKGLKTRIYKAAPFVRAQNSGNTWFDVEVGGVIRDVFEAENEFEVGADEFINIINKARKSGEEYVLYKGNWVRVPDNGEPFIEAYDKYNTVKKNRLTGIELNNYIFDIFGNVEKLEYSADLLQEKVNLDQLKLDLDKGLLKINATLYPHQEAGYQWLTLLNYWGLGGLLADDMGLGKTLQVITLMAYLYEEKRLNPSLIIAPKSILDNWKKEILKFSGIKDIYIHRGKERIKESIGIKGFSVVITTYDTLVKDQLVFGEIDWKLIVCDEAQRIKNHSTYASHAVRALKGDTRLALTGTPVENRLGDLWSIMDYVQPGQLGSFIYFRKEFESPTEKVTDEKGIKEIEKRLIHTIRPIYLRREKEDVLKDVLPGKHEHRLNVELSHFQVELYKKEQSAYYSSIQKNTLNTINRLLLLCSHPVLLTKEDIRVKPLTELISEGPKLREMVKILRDIKKKKEKVVIFTRLRSMQYIIKRVINEYFDLDYCPVINGTTSFRQDIVDLFNKTPGFGCMILSPLAAGVGLNITGANHVIHFTRWWNPAVENQATDRVYRLGQKKEVQIYYPIMISSAINKTVEERLDQLLYEKRFLSKSVVVPNKFVQEEIIKGLSEMLDT